MNYMEVVAIIILHSEVEMIYNYKIMVMAKVT